MPYTNEQELITWTYLCHEWFTISIIYLINSAQDNLPQVLIKTIGFNTESILKDTILQHFGGIGFCKNVEQSDQQRSPNYYHTSTFWIHIEIVVPIFLIIF